MSTQSGIVIERSNPLPALEAFKLLDGVPKQDYESLKRRVDDYIDAEFDRRIQSEYLRGHEKIRELLDSGDPFLSQIVYVSSAREVLSLANKMKKCRAADSPLFHAYQAFYEEFAPIAQDLIALKDNVITRERIAREKEEAAAKVREAHFRDASSLMTALETHREEYVNRAVQLGQGQVDEVAKRIADNNGELERLLPGNTKTLAGIRVRNQAMDFYRGFCSFDYQGNQIIASMDPVKVEHYLDVTRNMATASYDAYIHKMIEKIGKPVSDASVRGNPWTGSILDVTCDDGETQKWSTKMIVNVSVLGKLFNQFPSRRVDRPSSDQDDTEDAAPAPSPFNQ